jgi:hypothetical protein
MALPKVDLPIFELKLVSVKDPIRFRPFLMKEEKILLMALQSGEDETIYKSIKQVINNCLLDNVDIDKIPIFDIEYLFLNIRARSVGEDVETYFICKNIIGKTVDEDGAEVDNECTNLMPVNINLLNIKPALADLPEKIFIKDKIGIKLNYPTLRNFKPLEDIIESDDSTLIYDMLYQWTDYVFDENGMYYKNETSKEEFTEFLESLTQDQFDRILQFFEDLPKIQADVNCTCNKCGHEHLIHLGGLNDFFT